MASKSRPKGSIKELLNLSSTDFKTLTERELRAIVTKLNDAANKRLKRISSSGFDELSSSFRARKGERFTISRGVSGSDLKTAYLNVKSFLQGKTSSLTGTKAYLKGFDVSYTDILGKPLDDPSNYDRRFKTKKILKKSVKKKIRDFWSKYEQWKEIQARENPDTAIGDTNINDVEEFQEEVYDDGKASISDMEEKAKEDYLKAEREIDEEDLNDYDEVKPVQPPKPKRPGKAGTKQNQHKAKRSKKDSRFKFESIKIF